MADAVPDNDSTSKDSKDPLAPSDKLFTDKDKIKKYTPNDDENDQKQDIELEIASNIDNANVSNNNQESNQEEKKDEFYTANAHRLRRIYHICIFLVAPIIYLWTAKSISDAINISLPKILSFLILLAIILECIRLKLGWIMFGMREYERNHISAQSWGMVSSLIVLLMAFPRSYSIAPVITQDANGKSEGSEAYACFGQIAIPIIWSLGIGDPLLGELKRLVKEKKIRSKWIMWGITYFVLFCIWFLCYFWCGTPWYLAIIIPPIAIIAEAPSIPHIDDNGLMLLVPLLFTLILEPWFDRSCNQIFYQ